MSDEKTAAKLPKPIALGGVAAAGLGLLGLASMTAGAVAVFETEVEAGPVALIGIGFIMLLIGVARQLPTRLKAGDYEAEFAAVEEAITALVAAVPSENLEEAEKAIDDLEDKVPQVVAGPRKAIAREYVLLSRLRQAVARVGLVLLQESPVAGQARADAVVQGPNGRKLWVLINHRYIAAMEVAVGAMLLRTIHRDHPEFVGVLVLTMGGPQSDVGSSSARTGDSGTVWSVIVHKGIDPTELDLALESFREIASESPTTE